jgi:hypothetical protein
MKVVESRDEDANVRALLGFLSIGRGIGAVVSGLLSEALLEGNPWEGQKSVSYGSEVSSTTVSTGVTATVGG